MPRFMESYRYLAEAVGPVHARHLSRAELVARVAKRLAGPAWSSVHAPSLDALMGGPRSVVDAREVLDWAGLSAGQIDECAQEFKVVAETLGAAYEAASLTCPPEWAVESGTSTILYTLVRTMRPANVVETGIANGHSSFVILSALENNGTGRLASVDIRHDVGGLVTPALTKRWTKIIVTDQRPGLQVLRNRLSSFEPAELFFHDGDHRFLGQMLDYALARKMLTSDGLLVSDDINTTSAWLDAGRQGLFRDSITLFDRRKAVGFARVTAASLK